MDETRWLECTDPIKMLRFLRGTVSARKLRLFACACCRMIWHLLSDECSRQAVEIAELVGEDRAGRQELGRASHRGREATMRTTENWRASLAAWCATFNDAFKAATQVIEQTSITGPLLRSEQHCRLLRDVFGNPFQQTKVDPAWMTANGGLPRKLAEGISFDRAFDRHPILADAVEDAGCNDTVLLSHLRQPGEHVLGCWALDTLLGRS